MDSPAIQNASITQRQNLDNLVLRLYFLYCLLTLVFIVTFAYGFFLFSWHHYSNQQRSLLASLAAQDRQHMILPSASLVLVHSAESLQVQAIHPLPNNSLWQRWHRRNLYLAQQQPYRSFTTWDSEGNLWLHTGMPTGAGEFLMLQQPFQSLFMPFYLALAGIIGLGILSLIAPFVAWRFFLKRFISPIRSLTEISEAIRWGGHLQESDTQGIHSILEQDSPLSPLAQSIMAMEQEIHQRFLHLSTLLHVSRIVTSSLQIDEVLDNILEQVQSLFVCDRCAIVTLNETQGIFRIRASRGLSPAYIEILNIAPTEPNSPTMRALRNQSPIQIADTETDLGYVEFRQRAQHEAFRSVLAIPLVTVHSPPSVLLLYKNIPYYYSHSERELAISFGNYSSLALENAMLYSFSDEQRRIQTSRLEAIVGSLSEGLILESDAQELAYINQQAQEMLMVEQPPKTLQEVAAQLLENVTTPEKAEEVYFAAYHRSGDASLDISRQLSGKQNQDLRIHFFDVKDVDGKRLGRGQLWLDISHDKQLDRMKSTLVSTVSHELRTPLATIKGNISSLLADDVQWDTKQEREFLQTISSETNRLSLLVTRILDLSQIEAGLLKLHYQAVSLNELILEILQSFPKDQRDLMQLEMDAKLPHSMMDASRIGTIIRNLLENAIKYGGEQLFRIYTRQEGDKLILQVRDYGKGIAEEDSTKIFERFYRSDKSLSSSGGFGLGLAISKGFAEAHQGELWFINEAQGVSFYLVLPIKTTNIF